MRRVVTDFVKIKDLNETERGRISSFGIDVSIFSDCYILPGFADVHVHLREPGFSYKETIKTGTLASAKGGYTTVFSMPNLNPVPDSLPNLNEQLKIIDKDAIFNNSTPWGELLNNKLNISSVQYYYIENQN